MQRFVHQTFGTLTAASLALGRCSVAASSPPSSSSCTSCTFLSCGNSCSSSSSASSSSNSSSSSSVTTDGALLKFAPGFPSFVPSSVSFRSEPCPPVLSVHTMPVVKARARIGPLPPPPPSPPRLLRAPLPPLPPAPLVGPALLRIKARVFVMCLVLRRSCT
jgi:hypothetical protein